MEQFLKKADPANLIAPRLVPHFERLSQSLSRDYVNLRWLIITIMHETDLCSSLIEYSNLLGYYRGAGLIMFSTKSNYDALSSFLNRKLNFIDLLDADIDTIAIVWFLRHRNMMYQRLNFDQFTHLITGAQGSRLKQEVNVRLSKYLTNQPLYNRILDFWRK